MQMDLLFDPLIWTKIGWAVGCGFLVGFERHLHKKPIDIRMAVLICMGTMIFIHLGTLATGSVDATRVLGQVVTGIGFLGAGTIITRQGLVTGLTSASVVWMLAAIGATIGFEYYEMACAFTIVTVFITTVLQWFDTYTEHWIKTHQK